MSEGLSKERLGEVYLLVKIESFGKPEQFDKLAQTITRELQVRHGNAEVYRLDAPVGEVISATAANVVHDPREGT